MNSAYKKPRESKDPIYITFVQSGTKYFRMSKNIQSSPVRRQYLDNRKIFYEVKL